MGCHIVESLQIKFQGPHTTNLAKEEEKRRTRTKRSHSAGTDEFVPVRNLHGATKVESLDPSNSLPSYRSVSTASYWGEGHVYALADLVRSDRK